MTYLENDELFTWGIDPLSLLIDLSWFLLWIDSSVGLWCRFGYWSKYFGLTPVHSMVGSPGMLS